MKIAIGSDHRAHNNANIACFGERVTEPDLAIANLKLPGTGIRLLSEAAGRWDHPSLTTSAIQFMNPPE